MIKYIDDKKVCSKCKEAKDVSQYDSFPQCGDGLYPSCKTCKKLFKKEWINNNRDKYLNNRRIYGKNYYSKNKEAIIKKTKEYHKKNPQVRVKALLNFYYGLSLEAYQEIVNRNNGRCYICNDSPTYRKLFIDHCHLTNKVRGALCSKCNTILGFCNDKIEILESAIKYLKKENNYVRMANIVEQK